MEPKKFQKQIDAWDILTHNRKVQINLDFAFNETIKRLPFIQQCTIYMIEFRKIVDLQQISTQLLKMRTKPEYIFI